MVLNVAVITLLVRMATFCFM